MNSFRRRGGALPLRMGTPSGKPSPTSGNRKRQDAFHRRRFLHGGSPVAPTRRKEKTMGEYTCTVSCRMTEEDRQLLDERAERLELANSEAIRALLRLPIADPDDLVAIDAGSRVVVIDARTMGRINRELIRWGRHYNQAVRALNTIAMFARNKGGIDPQVAKEQLTKAASELELVQGSVEEIKDMVQAVHESERFWR